MDDPTPQYRENQETSAMDIPVGKFGVTRTGTMDEKISTTRARVYKIHIHVMMICFEGHSVIWDKNILKNIKNIKISQF
jgi:hypothetical protein